MGWQISASGTKENCKAQLENARHQTEGDVDAREYDNVKRLLLHELDRLADGTGDISITAQGSFPGEGGGMRTLSIWMSGTGVMRSRDDHAKPQMVPAPSLPGMVPIVPTPVAPPSTGLSPEALRHGAMPAAQPSPNPVQSPLTPQTDPHPITSSTTPAVLPPSGPVAPTPVPTPTGSPVIAPTTEPQQPQSAHAQPQPQPHAQPDDKKRR